MEIYRIYRSRRAGNSMKYHTSAASDRKKGRVDRERNFVNEWFAKKCLADIGSAGLAKEVFSGRHLRPPVVGSDF